MQMVQIEIISKFHEAQQKVVQFQQVQKLSTRNCNYNRI